MLDHYSDLYVSNQISYLSCYEKKQLKQGSAYFGLILQRINPSWQGGVATAERHSWSCCVHSKEAESSEYLCRILSVREQYLY